jgi:hypothetical protein
MTNIEIQKRRKELENIANLTKEQKVEDKELSLREYINSCITYGQEYLVCENGQVTLSKQSWSCHDYTKLDGKKVISDQRVLELFNEQKKTFADRAIIRKDVYTDGEGVTYNSVVWL